MLVATILYVAALTATGADDHAAAAHAANQVATEKICPATPVVAGAAVLVKIRFRLLSAGLDSQPKVLRNNATFGYVNAPPLRSRSRTAHFTTSFRVPRFLRPAPHIHPAIALVAQNLVNGVP